jgi:hypothetical protein
VQGLFSTGLRFGRFVASGGLLLICGHTDSATERSLSAFAANGHVPAPTRAAGFAEINAV